MVVFYFGEGNHLGIKLQFFHLTIDEAPKQKSVGNENLTAFCSYNVAFLGDC